MAGCTQIQVLDPPSHINPRLLINGALWLDVEFSATTILNKEELSDINEITVSGVLDFSVSIADPRAKALISGKWRPNGAIKNQKPYKVRIWNGAKVEDQKYLFCTGIDESGCNYRLTASHGRDHWIFAFEDCDLCDVFYTDGDPDTIVLGPNNLSGEPNPIQQGLDNFYYNDGDTGVAFLLACYGDTYIKGSFSPYDFRPFVNPLYLLRKALCHCGGWRLKAPIFEADIFRRMWLYLLDENYGAAAFSPLLNGDYQLAINYHTATMCVPPLSSPFLSAGLSTTPIDNPNGLAFDRIYCIDFQKTIENIGGFYSGGRFIIPNNAEIGVCAKWKIEFTGSLLPSDVDNFELEIMVVQHTPTNTGQEYFVVNSESHTINTDKFPYTIEGEIDVECIKRRGCPDPQNPEYISICFNVPIGPSQTFLNGAEVEYFEARTKIKRFLYAPGTAIYLNEEITCDKSVLDLLKMMVHMIDGKIETSTATKTICVFPPVNVELADGTMVEGWDNGDPPLPLDQLMICKSHIGQDRTQENARFCKMGFKESKDSEINKLYIDGQPFDYTHDFGDQYEPKDVCKRNPSLEPTIMKKVNDLTFNGEPVYLPNISTKDEGIDYPNTCRVVIANDGQQISVETGEFPVLKYCDENGEQLLSVFVTAYQSLYQQPFTIGGTSYPVEEYISYGPQWDDEFNFYDMMYRHTIASINTPTHAFDFYLCGLFLRDMRRKRIVVYEGNRYKLSVSQFQLNSCDRRGTIIGNECEVLKPSCFEAFEDEQCKNYPRITCVFDKDTNCYTLTEEGNFNSAIEEISWECEDSDGSGGWTNNTTQAGTSPTTLEVCDKDVIFRCRSIVKFEIILDDEGNEIQCPDVMSGWLQKDPCGNNLRVSCVDLVEKTDPCENCFKLQFEGEVCDEIQSITATLKTYGGCGTDEELLEEIPINIPPFTVPLEEPFISEEFCAAGARFEIVDLKIEFTNECPDLEFDTIEKVWSDCCFDDTHHCVDCVVEFTEGAQCRTIKWYKIKAPFVDDATLDQTEDFMTYLYDLAKIDTDPVLDNEGNEIEPEVPLKTQLIDFVKECFPVYGPYECAFKYNHANKDYNERSWFFATIEKEGCDPLCLPYLHLGAYAGEDTGRPSIDPKPKAPE